MLTISILIRFFILNFEKEANFFNVAGCQKPFGIISQISAVKKFYYKLKKKYSLF